MRIGVFTYGIEGQRMTGIARYAVELTRALRRVEPDLEIVLLNPYPESDHAWYREFPTYPLPLLRTLPMAATLGNWQLHRAASELELDVLHDPCGIAPFLMPKQRYLRVTTVHDAIPALYPETQPLLTRLVFQTLVRASARTADAVLTVSQASADDLHRVYGLPRSTLHAIPNGVTRPEPQLPQDVAAALERLGVERPYYLYVGALHPRKNLARVCEAFARVRATHPETRLVIVGPPSWGAHETLRGVLEQARSESGVTFTGFVSDDDLAVLYRGALALVFPSLYEGFGLPALEAMSHGAPVVTSNVSSLPEVVGEAALLVDPTIVEAIADAMARLVVDEPLRARLADAGRRRAAGFTWEDTARRTLDVFRAGCHESPGP